MSAGATDEYSQWRSLAHFFPRQDRDPTNTFRSLLAAFINNLRQGADVVLPLVARDLNRSSWNSVLFRPRSMVDVDVVDTRTKMMGYETSLPVRTRPWLAPKKNAYCPGLLTGNRRADELAFQIFIAPAGMAGLAHPSGERLLARGAGETGIIQMVSSPCQVSATGSEGPNISYPSRKTLHVSNPPHPAYHSIQLMVGRRSPPTRQLPWQR